MRRIHSIQADGTRLYIAVLMILAAAPALADRLELLSGGTLEGQVTGRDAQSITLQMTQNGQTLTRKIPVERIKAVVIGDKREVLGGGNAGGNAATGAAQAPAGPAAKIQRTKAEVDALIEQQGRAVPDWWAATPLEYPQTLDLTWPEPAPGKWNAKRNIGQYLWDVIYPNSSKWHSGTRFIHTMLTYHKANPTKQLSIMNTLGHMYFSMLEDYPRAAFWWRKAGVEQGDRFFRSGISLAECYWRMGNKAMALTQLNRCGVQFETIKLLGDMGETQAALRLAEANVQGGAADQIYLYAGDACRVAGDHARALQYYQKALAAPSSWRNKMAGDKFRLRLQANIDAIKAFDLFDLKRVPDGKYQSSCQGYEAEVGVEVAVKGGRIESARVTRHHEKQFYTAMTDTPRKIIMRQGVTGIDATSGATITAQAIVNATAKALAGAMK